MIGFNIISDGQLNSEQSVLNQGSGSKNMDSLHLSIVMKNVTVGFN